MFETLGGREDCGTALWFPEDKGNVPGREYALTTFHKLRGGNISLLSSSDGMKSWGDERLLLTPRSDQFWDNTSLSMGPSPVQLSDGNWLLLYNVDNLWPVYNPRPLPKWGRCALGWAVLDQHNLTRVLARAPEPLVHAEYRCACYCPTVTKAPHVLHLARPRLHLTPSHTQL